MKNALPGLVIGLVGAAYLAACSALGGLQHASTALVLAFPAAYVYFVTRNDRHEGNETASTCDWLVVAYAVLYVAVVFRINILGASVGTFRLPRRSQDFPRTGLSFSGFLPSWSLSACARFFTSSLA